MIGNYDWHWITSLITQRLWKICSSGIQTISYISWNLLGIVLKIYLKDLKLIVSWYIFEAKKKVPLEITKLNIFQLFCPLIILHSFVTYSFLKLLFLLVLLISISIIKISLHLKMETKILGENMIFWSL